MAHISPDFKTKKSFKEAVKNGEKIQVFNPSGLFSMAMSGRCCIEAPAEYHKWYAEVEYKNFIVVKVIA